MQEGEVEQSKWGEIRWSLNGGFDLFCNFVHSQFCAFKA